jgi:hypothetical protein
MNPFDSETWKQQWTAFWSAPYIILPFIMVSLWAAWWFRGRTSEGEIAGLEREISALNERLRLAADLVAASDRAKDELEKQFQAYEAEVAAKGSNASPVKVEAAIVGVAKSNTEIRDKLVGALLGREYEARHSSLPLGAGY